MPHPVTIGKRTRMSFSKIKEIADVPNLIELQVDSYKWFIEEGLKEVFEDISPIEDYTGNLILEFVDYSLDDKPKYDIEECKDRDATYCAPLKVKVRLINKETGEIKEQEVFMGDFPLMTEKGTFVINGAERDSYKLDLSFPDGSQIELFSFPNSPQRVTSPEACGLRHLAFKVENIDEYVAYLLENGVSCEPIRVDELTRMKYTFFRDPDYLPIELYENNY